MICILKIGSLSEFKENEGKIFAIEEDPYQYKKYILYYSEVEKEMIKDKCYKDIIRIISDKNQFRAYKIDPLQSSIYSLAAKIFIKLPFLELPHEKKDLVPLKLQAKEIVDEVGLSSLYEKIQNSLCNGQDEDIFIKELIQNELENITD